MRFPRVSRAKLAVAAICVCVLGYMLVLPSWASGYTVTVGLDIMLFASLAYSWNVISGYTGYISFGNIAFFGVGGYTLANLIKHFHFQWLLACLLGAVMAALVAAALGVIMLRLREAYFAIGMLAISVAGLTLAELWSGATGGGAGLQLPPRLAVNEVYFAFLGLTVVCVLGSLALEHTTFGLRLMAIREDEVAAQAHGVNTTLHKTVAFVLSAAIAGFAGGLEAFYLSYLDPPTAFNAVDNVMMIMMALFGGAGTVLGPLVGAVVLGLLYEWLWSSYPKLYLAIFGVLIILIVLVIPRGIVPYAASLSRLWRRRQSTPEETPARVPTPSGSA